jgi:hypothetical protein
LAKGAAAAKAAILLAGDVGDSAENAHAMLPVAHAPTIRDRDTATMLT